MNSNIHNTDDAASSRKPIALFFVKHLILRKNELIYSSSLVAANCGFGEDTQAVILGGSIQNSLSSGASSSIAVTEGTIISILARCEGVQVNLPSVELIVPR